MTSLIAAYRFGSVVSVATVYGLVPLVVMALLFLLFRERPSKVIMGCSVLALVGIYITAGAAVNLNEVIGIGLAFLMTLCVGGIILIARSNPDTPLMVASVLASVISSLWRSNLGDWSGDVGFGGTAASFSAGIFNRCAGCTADTRLDFTYPWLGTNGA
jgi:drug/metabolite transporter (DMT)-like permease